MMRILTAQSKLTGKWFQRIDTGDQSAADFASSIAKQFKVDVADVTVISQEGSNLDYDLLMAQLTSGMKDGASVVGAPVEVIPLTPMEQQILAVKDVPSLRAIVLQMYRDWKHLG